MFKLPKRVTIYKVRIVYKSGYFHDFEARQFTRLVTEKFGLLND
jgi:hypothetical protein